MSGLEDDRPYWQRHYGIGRPWNKSGLRKFVAFTAAVLGAMVLVFGVLYVAAWLTAT